MKRVGMAVMLVVFLCGEAAAQQAVVHFKKLQEALPTAGLAGFTRGKPVGSTSTAMGITASEASVRFEKPGGESGGDVSIEVKISDTVGVPFAGMALAVPQVESESETESGYQKTVTVKKKYKASEEAQTGESPSVRLTIPVAGRFMVELEGSGTSDAKLLHTLAEGMALEKLEAAAGGK